MAPMKRPAATTAGALNKKPAIVAGLLKRPAATVAGALNRKPSTVVGAAPGVDEVAHSLQLAGTLPEGMKTILCEAAPICLSKCVEERHPFEQQLVEMMSSTLQDVQTEMESRISEVKAQIAGSVSRKLELDASLASEEETLHQKKSAVIEKTNTVEVAAAAVSAARLAVNEAAKPDENVKAILRGMSAKRDRLICATEALAELRDGPQEGERTGARRIKQLQGSIMKVGAEFQFDRSLLCALEGTLDTTISDRTEFDSVILSQFLARCTKNDAELESKIQELEPERSQCEEKLAAAKADLERAELTLTAHKDGLDTAEAEHNTANSAMSAAREAVDCFVPSLEATIALCAELESRLDAFIVGPLRTFNQLKEKVPASEQQEEVREMSLTPLKLPAQQVALTPPPTVEQQEEAKEAVAIPSVPAPQQEEAKLDAVADVQESES